MTFEYGCRIGGEKARWCGGRDGDRDGDRDRDGGKTSMHSLSMKTRGTALVRGRSHHRAHLGSCMA
jgi:hypothetical protein